MSTRETLKAIHDRGDLLPWLNGETECLYHDVAVINARFDGPLDAYTFRPVPKPTYRPWTADELWSHRDCWFRLKDYPHLCGNIMWINTRDSECSITGDKWKTKQLLEGRDYLAADGTWQPCGVLETERT